MLEIEQKYANADFTAIKEKLSNWGVVEWTLRQEADHYLNAPDRDFAQTKEAFRLRRVAEMNYLTYKGPRIDPNVKIRPELELRVADGEQSAEEMLQLFEHLGYRRVAVVRKSRAMASFSRQGFTITACLDDVEGIGAFAELEIVAPEDQMEAARATLLACAAELGLEQVVQASYLTLHLAAQGKS